jgi:hypothetical protein
VEPYELPYPPEPPAEPPVKPLVGLPPPPPLEVIDENIELEPFVPLFTEDTTPLPPPPTVTVKAVPAVTAKEAEVLYPPAPPPP